MAISEKRFAAEFITKDRDARKFDDIGCMRDYIKERKNEAAIETWYVSDYDSGKWLAGKSADFVQADSFRTPMGSGIVAVEAHTRAVSLASENNGRFLKSGEVFPE